VRPRSQNFHHAARSVSCEVELEPGTYEVLPKITAKKMEKPAIEDVVRVLADRKPQKLRQVGLSFDLAHAKALKSDLAREIEKKEKEAAEEVAVKEEEDEWEDEEEDGDEEDAEEDEEDDEDDEEETEEEEAKPVKSKAGKKGKKDKPEEKGKKAQTKKDKKAKKSNKEEAKEEGEEDDEEEGEDGPPDALVIFDAGGDEGQEESGESGEPNESAWNAVCVIGLRVYSQGSDVTIELADPKDLEEGASLTVSS